MTNVNDSYDKEELTADLTDLQRKAATSSNTLSGLNAMFEDLLSAKASLPSIDPCSMLSFEKTVGLLPDIADAASEIQSVWWIDKSQEFRPDSLFHEILSHQPKSLNEFGVCMNVLFNAFNLRGESYAVAAYFVYGWIQNLIVKRDTQPIEESFFIARPSYVIGLFNHVSAHWDDKPKVGLPRRGSPLISFLRE
jgi:hypothetical protein